MEAPIKKTLTLNDLPEELLLRILTFLPTLDSVQTSVISQKWRHLWSRVPSLDFPFETFPPYDSPSDTRQGFAEFVDRVLIRRWPHPPIDSFRLNFVYYDHFAHHVDSWLHAAVHHLRARRLHVDLFVHQDLHDLESISQKKYEFHFSILRGSSVETLTLAGCNLVLPEKFAVMRFPAIGSLSFRHVYMTDEMVHGLISACPNLETLELHNPWGTNHLEIRSARLKRLVLDSFIGLHLGCSLLVDCPNLCSIDFEQCRFEKFSIKNTSSLVEFRIYFMHSVWHFYDQWTKVARLLEYAPNVKHLNVQNWWFKFLTSKDSLPKSFMFHNLNLLELKTGFTQYDLVGMAAMLKLSPNLKTLRLQFIYKIGEDDNLPEELLYKPVEFSIPKLKRITMTSYTGTEDEEKFRQIVIKQGVALQEIVLVHGQNGNEVEDRERFQVGEKPVPQVHVYRKGSQGWKKYSHDSSTTPDSMDTGCNS